MSTGVAGKQAPRQGQGRYTEFAVHLGNLQLGIGWPRWKGTFLLLR